MDPTVKPDHGELKVVRLVQLHEAADNPNSMEPEQYAMLVEAVRRVGFLQPVLVREVKNALDFTDYEVIDGHHRIKAARELGYSEVPCVVIDADDNTAIALRVGMNRLRGELNLSSVAVAMEGLVTNGWKLDDLTLTGFSADEVADLLASLKLNEDDVLGQNVQVGELGGDELPSHPFVLEIQFTDRAAFKKAKAGLKRAAGKSGDIGRGLLRLLGE